MVLRWLDCDPLSVSAVGGAWTQGHGGEARADAVFATLTYPNDVLVNLHVSCPTLGRSATSPWSVIWRSSPSMTPARPIQSASIERAHRTPAPETSIFTSPTSQAMNHCGPNVNASLRPLERPLPLSDGVFGQRVVRVIEAIEASMRLRVRPWRSADWGSFWRVPSETARHRRREGLPRKRSGVSPHLRPQGTCQLRCPRARSPAYEDYDPALISALALTGCGKSGDSAAPTPAPASAKDEAKTAEAKPEAKKPEAKKPEAKKPEAKKRSQAGRGELPLRPQPLLLAPSLETSRRHPTSQLSLRTPPPPRTAWPSRCFRRAPARRSRLQRTPSRCTTLAGPPTGRCSTAPSSAASPQVPAQRRD